MTEQLTVSHSPIPDLLVIELPVHGDARGWFKENWQREAMLAAGLPDFGPVQNNISYNAEPGTTRGMHAEPWDKLVSVASGRIFGAWVDLREGPSFGRVFTLELGPDRAVFVPRGVANGYQTLEAGTAYSYLVNDHWSPEAAYTFLNVAGDTTRIAWPIPLERAVLSDKDRQHPALEMVSPVPPRATLVTGAGGQLGRALRRVFPRADFVARDDLDVTAPDQLARVPWRQYDTIINAAAYTKVDEAETPDGRSSAWAANAEAVASLARVAAQHRLTLVHVSSDYVFDGTRSVHTEDEPFSPLGAYGQSKAAGDIAARTAPHHFIVRTSWVIGDGSNFVRTIRDMARNGLSPSVVDDQYGRLTFAEDLARGIRHLLDSRAPWGTYNITNAGPVQSWAGIAAQVFEACGRDGGDVRRVTTDEYGHARAIAPRPANSTLDTRKIESVGFTPRYAIDALHAYLAALEEAEQRARPHAEERWYVPVI
ncbi:dTDP-4-dehydrorhamnose reductase /dTDP-4-dehydrorhamnose 3,5-epimerase [Paramicrobacterium humi]|uniref:dTDP-4-dehydrorhamnose reductase n=1 Tax=Paramicrobacterium humi TaxID=640635 RepID=A0A1H4IUL7_9MICO|nr:bifunctional dTDP-4-dehydrorhamnose 3,5-epimerase family protein/NAD(P)-dependent oxidoreductase [Microbacterium humi]SEB36998.1 dTDP-4-dehydrorhamnose reductase /dTDP-4-dehydrorhamnose 3,5-epimerase [Microbacterium humi]